MIKSLVERNYLFKGIYLFLDLGNIPRLISSLRRDKGIYYSKELFGKLKKREG